MFTRKSIMLAATAAILVLALWTEPSQAQPGVYVGAPGVGVVIAPQAPPAPRPEVMVGVAPSPGYVWVPGYWSWNGAWVWMPGRWAAAPHPHAVWVPGHWRQHGPGGWAWVPGHWRR